MGGEFCKSFKKPNGDSYLLQYALKVYTFVKKEKYEDLIPQT
jgi:hypothetical protein